MMHPKDLVIGNYYFVLWYFHDDREIPCIKTWIYYEKTVDENGIDMWIFRSPSSDEDSEEGAEELPLKEEQLLMILDIHGLQRALFEIEDLYPTEHSTSTSNSLSNVQSAHSLNLDEHIRDFVTSTSNTLIVTVRYTQYGMSLLKRNDGLEVTFFIHWRIEPGTERKVRALFSDLGITPSKDYCARRPRVRILTYPLPLEHAVALDVAKKVFFSVYDISAQDELTFRVAQLKAK